MRTTKKILSMILAFVLVLGLLPATAFATATGEDVVYLSISFDGKYIDAVYYGITSNEFNELYGM